MDFINKGGAECLQAALLSILKAESRIESDAVDDIVRIICAVSHPYVSALSEEAVRQAVSKSLEGTIYEMFIEASSAMAEAVISVQHLIETVIEPWLEVASEGEGARETVQFIISTGGEAHIRERCLTMTEGFCEHLDAAKVWIVANVCLHLAYAVLNEIESIREFDWNWMYGIIEFVREGVMQAERTPGRTGEVAGRRMVYWLEQSCKCRSAWGARQDHPVDDFHNQVQYEESCILMGAQSRS